MKTIYINLKFFPIKDALKFPIIIFGQCSFTSLSGKFIINTPIKTGIITFGHRFEIFKKSAKSAELFMQGTWEVNGPIQIGYDFKIYIERSEEHTSELQSRENLVCRLLLEKKKKH